MRHAAEHARGVREVLLSERIAKLLMLLAVLVVSGLGVIGGSALWGW